jgi:KDO2-lipid IV(A) lauroyltransferase
MKKPLRYRLEYYFARIVLFSVNLLPEFLSYRLADVSGRLFFRFSKRRRLLALRILRNAYPGQDDRTLLALGRRATGNMFKMPLDMVRVTTAIRRGRLAEVIDMSEAKLLVPPAPFIGMTGHVGSWETGAVAMAHLSHEAHAIVRTFRNPLLTRFVFDNRRLAGLHLHSHRGGIRGMAAAVRRGCVVLQAADQRRRTRGVWVPFFGELASTDRSGVTLALRQGCPILVGRCERIGMGFRFRMVFSKPFHPEVTGDRAEDVRRAATEVNRRLEEHILACPDQYVWIHDRYRQGRRGNPDEKATS